MVWSVKFRSPYEIKRGYWTGFTSCETWLQFREEQAGQSRDDLWTKFDEGVINISQFLDLACNFFEPDRDLPRPTFDTSARPARRGNARRRRQLQPSGALPDDANGTICYYDFRPSAFNVKLIIFILIAIVIRQDDSFTNDSSSQLQSIDTTANQ
jgi:hypothetical protein